MVGSYSGVESPESRIAVPRLRSPSGPTQLLHSSVSSAVTDVAAPDSVGVGTDVPGNRHDLSLLVGTSATMFGLPLLAFGERFVRRWVEASADL